jgi:hypothetical protein
MVDFFFVGGWMLKVLKGFLHRLSGERIGLLCQCLPQGFLCLLGLKIPESPGCLTPQQPIWG